MMLLALAPVLWERIGLGDFGGHMGFGVKSAPLCGAVALLVVSGVGHELVRFVTRAQVWPVEHTSTLVRFMTPLFWVCLLGIWSAFWIYDLRHARFQMILVAIPACTLLVGVVQWRAAPIASALPLWMTTLLLVAVTPSTLVAIARREFGLGILLFWQVCATAWIALFLSRWQYHRPSWTVLRSLRLWRNSLGAGAIIGFAMIWPVTLDNSYNGCTGVSKAYSWTLFVTLLILYGIGPVVLSRCLSSDVPSHPRPVEITTE